MLKFLRKSLKINKTKEKINCWEYKKCGREPGGENYSECSECPVISSKTYNKINFGQNGGRFCWYVAGTFCGGKAQGSFANKIDSCIECKFLQKVASEEKENFIFDLENLSSKAKIHHSIPESDIKIQYQVKGFKREIKQERNNKIIFILADGFEEVEALAPIDFLRRLGFEITIVGAKDRKIKGAHDIIVEADMKLADLSGIPKAVILPGGMPGSVNLRDNKTVLELVRNTYEKGNLVAAICAAPIALNAAGILAGKTITAHPSVEDTFGENVNYTGNRVERDGNIITAKAAGVSFEFAAEIAEYYNKKEETEALLKAMYVVAE